MDTTVVTLACGLALIVGIVGTVVPILPGGLLIAAAVAIWAFVMQTTAAWVVLGVVLVLLAAGQALSYLIAGRRLLGAGVPRRSLVIGGLGGIAGFFLIPVVGLPIGFIAALYAAELHRLRPRPDAGTGTIQNRRAWDSAIAATKAVGISIMIETAAALTASAAWLAGVLVFDAG